MSYRMAGIDVHKKMLAIVVSDVEVDAQFQFERRMFGSNPEQLRALAAWLVEREVEEVVMESTAQSGSQCGKRWKDIGSLYARSEKARSGGPEGCIWHRQSPIADDGDAEGFRRCRTPGEATGGPGTDSELCTRCRATSMADGNAQEVPVEACSDPVAEPIGISSRRSPYQVVQLRLGLAGFSARRMLKALAEGETNPAALAALADERLRATPEQLSDALGACTELNDVYRRLLQMALEECRLLDEQIGELDQEMASLLSQHQDAVERLAEVPGLGVDSAQQIIAEVGPAAATFPSEKCLSSWVGACPGEEESARRKPQPPFSQGQSPHAALT